MVPEGPTGIGFNGSYMVVRKLEQDVEGFWDFLHGEAEGDAARTDWLAAKIVGRWRDGTPLVRSPHTPRPELSRTSSGATNSATGPIGTVAPVRWARTSGGPIPATRWSSGAPDRRATGSSAAACRTPRSCQRMTKAERGLMFVAYNASIVRQFEFVQSQWMGDGNAFGLGIGSRLHRGWPRRAR